MVLTYKKPLTKSLHKEKLEKAAIILKNGGIVVHPTETVYGIAAIWNNHDALKKVANLKNRDLKKPFSILVNKINQILKIAGWKSDKLEILLSNVFPAPLTIILPRKSDLAVSFWNQFSELGFRVPDFQLCEELVEMVGEPLITTSANLSGQPSPKTFSEIERSLVNAVDLALDGGRCPIQIPSTAIRFNPESGKMDVLREGGFPSHKFQEHLKAVYG